MHVENKREDETSSWKACYSYKLGSITCTDLAMERIWMIMYTWLSYLVCYSMEIPYQYTSLLPGGMR